MKRTDVVVGVVSRGGSILVCRRKPGAPLGGYWEFPGGKVEIGETLEAALHRELWEELRIRVSITRSLAVIEHDYPGTTVRLHPYLCQLEAGEPEAIACDETRWITPATLSEYRFPPANDSMIIEVRQLLAE